MIKKYIKNNILLIFYNYFTNDINQLDIVDNRINHLNENYEYFIDNFFTKEIKEKLSPNEIERVNNLLKKYNDLYIELINKKNAGEIPKQRLEILQKSLDRYRIDNNDIDFSEIENITENTSKENEIYLIIISELEKGLEYVKNELDIINYLKRTNEENLEDENLNISRLDDLIDYFQSEKTFIELGNNREGGEDYIKLCLDKLYEIRYLKVQNDKSKELFNNLKEKDPRLSEIADYNLQDFLKIPLSERLKYVTLERKDFSEIKDDIINGNQKYFIISFDYGGNINKDLESGLSLFMLLPDEIGKVYVGGKEYIRKSLKGPFIGEDGEILRIDSGTIISFENTEKNNNLDSFIGEENELIIIDNGKEKKYKKVDGIFRKDGKENGEILVFENGMIIKKSFSTIGINNINLPGLENSNLGNIYKYNGSTIRSKIELIQKNAYLNSIKNSFERLGVKYGFSLDFLRDLDIKINENNVEADIGFISRIIGDISIYKKENISNNIELRGNLIRLFNYLSSLGKYNLEGILEKLDFNDYGKFEGLENNSICQEFAEFCLKFRPIDGKINLCGRNVGDVLEAFGKFENVSELRGHGADWGANLAKRSDFTEVTDVYDVLENPPPAGAIISYDRNSGGSSARRSFGHVEVALGDGRYYFGQIASGPGGSNRNPQKGTYRIFLPGTP